MMTARKKHIAAVGTTAAIALALSGAFVPTAAIADEESTAPTSGAAFDATAKQLLTDEGVQAVATDGQGRVVVYTTTPQENLEGAADEFVEGNSNVVVKVIDAPFTTTADTDVVGGAGYFAVDPAAPDQGALCSVGFTGWNATGDPAIISAGHCTDDGLLTASALTLPTGDPAGGGASDNDDVALTYLLGELEFSQYGGPGNTPGTEGSEDAVDISVWDVVNSDLTLLPEITDWTTAASEDLSASTTQVRSVGTAQLGTVEKSGRTTGHTTGNVEAVGGWANVDGRQVYGFLATLDSAEGDSGGALYQGTTAVGILSGGTTSDGVSLTWGADLQAGLSLTGGYSVAVFVDAPVLASPADGGQIGAGGTISGTGPANHTLVVTPDGEAAFEVPIDGSGNWSFPAPDEYGDFEFTLLAKQGFNESAEVSYSVEVLPAPPVITVPGDGARIVTELTEISGTGVAGATLTLTGAVDETTTVGSDGTWSVETDLGIGAHEVTARQSSGGVVSASATASFAVVPAAPTVNSPLAGARFAYESSPTGANGAGLNGADITVTLDGAAAGETEVVDGAWSVQFAAPAAGAHTLVVTQTVNGQTSDPTTVTFEVAAAPVVPGPGGGSGGSGSLPATGMSDITPFVGGAVALLLAGIALVAFRRSRTQVGQQ
ncbi:S1 family peptidase [Microbacterium sp. 18062]|uniref:S1 family peptidase n=1 Tax=Microbacterium sp. 18062 TaxID=2681410 RepID=UPI00135775D4|nr:S1 family peptidase [Microbacterium sp. 18062]